MLYTLTICSDVAPSSGEDIPVQLYVMATEPLHLVATGFTFNAMQFAGPSSVALAVIICRLICFLLRDYMGNVLIQKCAFAGHAQAVAAAKASASAGGRRLRNLE